MKKILIFLISTTFLFANNTLPPNHWTVKSINKFKICGFFEDHGLGNNVFTRQDIAQELIEIELVISNFPSLKREYDLLIKEFTDEIQKLDKDQACIRLETNFETNFDFLNEVNNQIFNPSIFISLNEYFSIKYSTKFDRQMDNNPNYVGREYFNTAGYQDQAYISLNFNNVIIQYGRDYIKWGYGKASNLLISDNSRTFDMLHIKSNSKSMSFDYILSQLDDIGENQRYLSATRFEYRFPFKLSLGLGQTALYGGENQNIDFALSNPMSISYVVQHNDRKSVNSMFYADIAYFWKNQFKFYGELLIDDFQAEDEKQGDQEPNEIGFTLGCEFVDIIYGIDGFIEFTQVRNRTYNVDDHHGYEKFIHRNETIGHELGTDFQYLNFDLEKWISSKFILGAGYYRLNKGEGTVLGTFTTPWNEIEGNYQENIPYGIVETTNRFYLKMQYQNSSLFLVNGKIGYQTIDNFLNIDGNENTSLWGQISLDVFLNKGIGF